MGHPIPHQITVCTSCKHKGTACRPGYELINKLRQAIDAAGDSIASDFAISGVACMGGCDHPCTVAYYGTGKATYLFGDIDADVDVDDLVTFAAQYAQEGDGWCSSTQRPGKLRSSTLARIPAAMIVTEASNVRLS
jgi:predicted metal-binding protein